MRACLAILLLALAACDSPSPRFAGGERSLIEVEGSRFSVYRVRDEVEAYRLSREARPREEEVRRRAILGIEAATGCWVRPGSVSGDQAIVRAKIDCMPAGK